MYDLYCMSSIFIDSLIRTESHTKKFKINDAPSLVQ